MYVTFTVTVTVITVTVTVTVSDTVVCFDLQYNVIAHGHANDSTIEQGDCEKIERR